MKSSALLPVLWRLAKRARHDALDRFLVEPRNDLVSLGQNCRWTVCGHLLGPGSIVYSAGAGDDVSFELALARERGCRVILLDPSPIGQATMARPENRHERIEYLPCGLAGRDGEVGFARQLHSKDGRFVDIGTLQASGTGYAQGADAARLPVRSLASLARERGHRRIDLLKIDIEGFEYQVIEALCREDLEVVQVCVEFHDFMPGIPHGATRRAIRHLLRASYSLVHFYGHDHTFLRRVGPP